MEAEDDMIVLVVVDDDDESTKPSEMEFLSSEALNEVDDILEKAQKHGQFIEIKPEPMDDYPCDYLEDNNFDMAVAVTTYLYLLIYW